MNIIKTNGVSYKYEFFWRKSKNDVSVDSNNNLFPWPEEGTKWSNIEQFISKYKSVAIDLMDNGKFFRYDSFKNCLLCDKKNITTGYFNNNGIIWEDSLKHYVNKHNIKPSDEFIDFIYRYVPVTTRKPRVIARVRGMNVVKNDKKYLRVDRNQILIMDALMQHGRYKIYRDVRKNYIYRYSEHAGLLDFNNNKLEKIIIFANTTRVDNNDTDIFLPKNVPEALNYEYMFHTHPPTPKAGGRAEVGILYEFPSISDIFHFMDHYNEGETQGSIVITPEGMYIIRKKIQDDLDIVINENQFYKDMTKVYSQVQKRAIEKYGTKFTTSFFYSTISQDSSFIDEINKVLNKYKIHIDYYPRVRDNKNKWIIDTIYLPVYVVEYKK